MSAAPDTDVIMFAGNPGAGKSTLLNSLIGQAIFKSGLSVGTGLTAVLQEHRAGGKVYLDTPGLDDHDKRKAAGEAIAQALRMNGTYKIFFVCTLDNGRVKPADSQVIEVVLDAIKINNVPFYVIVNQVPRRLTTPDAAEKLRGYFVTGSSNGHRHSPDGMLLLERLEALEGQDNALLLDGSPQLHQLKQFVATAKPILIAPSEVACVRAYQEHVDLLAKAVDDQVQAQQAESARQRKLHEEQLLEEKRRQEQQAKRAARAAQEAIRRRQEEHDRAWAESVRRMEQERDAAERRRRREAEEQRARIEEAVARNRRRSICSVQ